MKAPASRAPASDAIVAPARDELLARLAARRIAADRPAWSPVQLEDLGAAAPAVRARPDGVASLSDTLAEATAAEVSLLPIGGGTALGLGHPPRKCELALDLTGVDRIVEHAVSDFVVTVEAGCRIAALQEALAPHGQWLAFEPADPGQATVGGLIATAASSLVAVQHGTLRNHVLGIQVLHADGRLAKAGGRVVKNVAGYDLMKLHHGALGTLGVIVAATLRLRPLPAADLVSSVPAQDPDALVDCASALSRPGFVPAGVHFLGRLVAEGVDGELVVRFQGARAAVLDQAAQVQQLLATRLSGWRQEALEPGARGGRPARLAELEAMQARGQVPGTLHVSLHWVPSRLRELLAALGRFGAGRILLDLGRGSGFLKVETEGSTSALATEVASALRTLESDLEAVGAMAHLHAGPPLFRTALAPFAPTEGVARLWKALKQELDPDGRLSPGRLGDCG